MHCKNISTALSLFSWFTARIWGVAFEHNFEIKSNFRNEQKVLRCNIELVRPFYFGVLFLSERRSQQQQRSSSSSRCLTIVVCHQRQSFRPSSFHGGFQGKNSLRSTKKRVRRPNARKTEREEYQMFESMDSVLIRIRSKSNRKFYHFTSLFTSFYASF